MKYKLKIIILFIILAIVLSVDIELDNRNILSVYMQNVYADEYWDALSKLRLEVQYDDYDFTVYSEGAIYGIYIDNYDSNTGELKISYTSAFLKISGGSNFTVNSNMELYANNTIVQVLGFGKSYEYHEEEREYLANSSIVNINPGLSFINLRVKSILHCYNQTEIKEINKVVILNDNPSITIDSPTSNSSLNSSQSMFKGVV